MNVSDDLDYRLLFEASPVGLLLADSHCRVLDANSAACRLLECARQDLLGSDLTAYWDGGDPIPGPAVDARRRQGARVGELRLLRRSTGSFLAEVSVIEYRRDDGDVRTALAFREVPVSNHSKAALRALSALGAVRTTRASSPSSPTQPAPGPPSVARADGPLADGHQPARSPALRPVVRPETLLGLLTPREMQVLYLLSRGQNNREIAKNLVISPGTAKLHVHRVITKLDVSDRTQAAIIAINAKVFDGVGERKNGS